MVQINLPKETHRSLKVLAARHDWTLGQAIKTLVDEHDCALDHYDEAIETP
jgi:hypothetical protein